MQTRRTFLRAASATLLLPTLQMDAIGQEDAGIPRRCVFISMGFGVAGINWFPDRKTTGKNYQLTPSLMPLERHKDDFSVIQNLSLQNRFHAHSGSHIFLTGANLDIVPGSQQNSISCDQVAAGAIGQSCRFPSMPVSGFGPNAAGHGPESRSLSWTAVGRSISGLNGPLAMYQTMYGDPSLSIEDLKNQLKRKKSSLDVLVREMKSLRSKVGKADHVMLDEYYSSIRDIERKLERALKWADVPFPEPGLDQPGLDLSGTEEVKVTYDLMTLAMQTDMTRVITYMSPQGSLVKDLGTSKSAHNLTHEGQSKTAVSRDVLNAELLSYLFDKLKGAKLPNGQSVFDHSLVSFGAGLREAHTSRNVPMILGGHGGGGIKQGQNIVCKLDETPLCNLWLSKLKHLDPTIDSFSASNDVLPELFG